MSNDTSLKLRNALALLPASTELRSAYQVDSEDFDRIVATACAVINHLRCGGSEARITVSLADDFSHTMLDAPDGGWVIDPAWSPFKVEPVKQLTTFLHKVLRSHRREEEEFCLSKADWFAYDERLHRVFVTYSVTRIGE